MSTQIEDLAASIWADLGDPTDLSVLVIQTKLASDAFIGKLNVLLGTCYTVTAGIIAPPLGTSEQAMYALLYQVGFWGRKIAQLSAGLIQPVVSLAEGDSRIVFSNRVDIMRIYRDEQKQALDELYKLVAAYRNDALAPQDIRFYNISNDNDGYYGNGYVGNG
jgi:hypothetical protein